MEVAFTILQHHPDWFVYVRVVHFWCIQCISLYLHYASLCMIMYVCIYIFRYMCNSYVFEWFKLILDVFVIYICVIKTRCTGEMYIYGIMWIYIIQYIILRIIRYCNIWIYIHIYGYIWNYMDDQKLPRYKVWPNQPSKTHLIVGHIAIGIGSAATVYAAAARTIKRTWWRRHHKSTLHQPADANKKLEALSLFHTLSYSFHPFHIKSPTPHQPMEKKNTYRMIQDDTGA